MAVQGVIPASLALFRLIPDRLFSPLASANRFDYWALLCALQKKRFGPDAPLPPSYGFLQREITQDIEDHLRYASEWQPEEGEEDGVSLNIRAIATFNRLLETGWFRLEKYGIEKTVNMSPAVGQFLTNLIEFAEKGPVFVSGKIGAIDAAISRVHSGEASGDLLVEAAQQCRALLVYIRNTGTNVRDLMTVIGNNVSTAQYVRTFFQDYVQQVFIGDYRELRTKEHPLSKRKRILDAVEDMDYEPHQRKRLTDWYINRLCGGDEKRGVEAFERDLGRLYELNRIEEYLERLDNEIRIANRRALATLEYKLRSIRPIDNLLRQAIDGLLTENETPLPAIFPPDVLMSGARLAEPRKEAEHIPPGPLRQVIISDRTRAIANLVRRAQERRTITAVKLREYAQKALADAELVNSHDMPAQTLEDLRSMQVLHSAAVPMNSMNIRLQLKARSAAPGLSLRYSEEGVKKHPFLSARPFDMSWRKRASNQKDKK